MSFLNQILAFGAAAALIPLIIHLFNRSRFRVVKWGAMHLLESVLRKNRKQVQLEQIILLIIRCAIPILLALCLARMVVTEWGPFLHRVILPLLALCFLILVALVPKLKKLFGILCAACILYALGAETGIIQFGSEKDEVSSLSGDTPASTVILLDDSFSMSAEGGFEKARTFSAGLLETLKKGSDASVVRMGGGASPIYAKPTSETETLGERAASLQAAYDRVDLAESLDVGLATVHEGRNAKRDIILVSDFRKSDWEGLGGSLAGLKERIEDEPVKPNLTLIDVGGKAAANVSVESIELSAPSAGTGQKVLIRADVRNHGSDSYDGDLPVRLYLDDADQPHDDLVTSLEPGETKQVRFTHAFEEAGSRVVTVEIGTTDALDADNRRSASITVLDRIGVLLVDGSPSPDWLHGETDFLKLALTPFGEAKAKGAVEAKDLIDATVVELSDFDPAKHLADQSVVVLANVARLTDEQLASLSAFVRAGGGLCLSLGDKVDAAWYNNVLGSDANALLPLPLRNLAGSLSDDTLRARIVAGHFEHPALSLFNDRRNGNLADADIRRWYRFDESDVNRARAATILARLETGHAFLAEKKVGKGVVLQIATAMDGDWSNLPVRACYVPLAQQVATYLADHVAPPRNLPAGATLAHFLSEDKAGETVTLTSPDGSTRKLKAVKRGGQAVVEFTETRRPGTYVISGAEIPPAKYVVGASTRESRLERLDEEEILGKLAPLADQVDYLDASDGDALAQYLALDAKRRHGRETWKLLLGAVLALLLVELILQRIFGRSRA